MTAYDVQVASESGRSGETIRVEADDAERAGAAALERVPAGWRVERVSDATDHGEAWGIDLTQNTEPAGTVIERAEDSAPLDWEPFETTDDAPGEAVVTEPPTDEPTA